MKLKKIILNNFGFKGLAFILAFLTWLYVGEATKQDTKKTVLQKLLSPASYITKKLYVKPIFISKVPEGYELAENRVKVTPEYIVVIGPQGILSTKEFVYTEPIDLSEHTKDKTLDVGLERISRAIRFQKAKVQVYLPVGKKEAPKE